MERLKVCQLLELGGTLFGELLLCLLLGCHVARCREDPRHLAHGVAVSGRVVQDIGQGASLWRMVIE